MRGRRSGTVAGTLAGNVLSIAVLLGGIAFVPVVAVSALDEFARMIGENQASGTGTLSDQTETAGIFETEGAMLLTESDRESGINGRIRRETTQMRLRKSGGEDGASRTGLGGPKVISVFPGGTTVSFGAVPAPVPGTTDGALIGRTGSYRTICVRLCDGYYWPISYGVGRGGLSEDAAACESSCGTPAKLFYYSTGGEAEEAVDLRGKPYTGLKHAFRYRTDYDPSCRCGPDPWDQASLDRHKHYAELEKAGRSAVAANESGKKKKKRKKGSDQASAELASFTASDGDSSGAVTVLEVANKKRKKAATVSGERSTSKAKRLLGSGEATRFVAPSGLGASKKKAARATAATPTRKKGLPHVGRETRR